jgi:type I pantothenate kinase
MTQSEEHSAYLTFGRSDWAALRFNTPLTLSDSDLSALRGLNEPITSAEVVDIYLPLTRLLNLHFAVARTLNAVKATFLGRATRSPPYIIAVALPLARAHLPARSALF